MLLLLANVRASSAAVSNENREWPWKHLTCSKEVNGGERTPEKPILLNI